MTTPQPAITGLTSDMPAGGYPAGTKTATVTATVALGAPGHQKLTVGLDGYPLASTALVLSLNAPIVVPVGATLTPLAWPADATGKHPPMAAVYQDWATQFGMPMAAKAYLHTFPTSLGQDGQLKGMSICGIKPVACYGGFNYTDLSIDRAPFIDSLKFLEQTFTNGGWIVFMQEPNNGQHIADPNWNPAAFTALSKARYQDVRATLDQAMWPVLFCPSTGGNYQSVTNWYPTSQGCDGIAPDHYCGSRGSAGAIPAFQLAAQIVARDNLPAGVGWLEIGISASANVIPPASTVTQMVADAASFFIARKHSGQACAPFCWWNGPLPGSPGRNTIWPKAFNPANNYMIPVWQNTVKQIAAA